MDVRKLWDSVDDKSEYKSVCDVYGAEHLARLIGMNPFLQCDKCLSGAFLVQVVTDTYPRSFSA